MRGDEETREGVVGLAVVLVVLIVAGVLVVVTVVGVVRVMVVVSRHVFRGRTQDVASDTHTHGPLA